MCRIALIVSLDKAFKKSGRGLGFSDVIEAFIKSSECDPYLASLTSKGDCGSHDDGWGYVLMGWDSEVSDAYIASYKTSRPVFKDVAGVNSMLNLLKEGLNYVLILHSRKASIGSKNVFNAHPFYFSGKGFDYWLVHNGTALKEELTDALNVTMREDLLDVSDTYLLGAYIYTQMNGLNPENVVNAYRKAVKFTKTALNTAALAFNTSKVIAVVTSYLSKAKLGNVKEVNYYRLYEYEGNGVRAVVSSTLALHLRNKGQVNEVPLQSGLLFNIDGDKLNRILFKLED